MDLKLTEISVCDYCRQMKTRTSVESDVIVPDTKPDIYRILSVKGTADVTERQLRKDKIIFSGKVKFNVLYVGENDKTALCSMEYISPFNHQAELPGADEDMNGICSCSVVKTSFEVKNSRKLSVGAVLEFSGEAVAQNEIEVLDGECENSDFPVRCEMYEGDRLTACKEFEFEITDTIPLPGKGEEYEVFDVNVRFDPSDIRTVNNKAVVKGQANISVIYSADGKLMSYDTESGFTEIIDIESVYSESNILSHFEISDVDYELSDMGTGASVDLKIDVKGYICAYDRVQYYVTSDIYSPDFNYEIVRRPGRLFEVSELVKDQTTVKDSVLIGDSMPEIHKVHHMQCSVSVGKIHTENGISKIPATLDSNLIYEDENGNLCKAQHSTSFEEELHCDSDNVFADFSCTNFGYVLNSSREIQVRAIVRKEICVKKQKEVSFITGFEVDEKSPVLNQSQPGIVICYPDDGADIWDIAKKYHTTDSEIASLNGIDKSAPLVGGKPLLIVKRQTVAEL